MDLSKYSLKIFNGELPDFEELALEVFQFQYRSNPVYQQFVDALGIPESAVTSLASIPFLPIRFFKSGPVKTGLFEPALVFESSGTTGDRTSRHDVKDAGVYEQSFLRGFERAYGPVSDWCILGLLPSYLERKNSSLVYMVDWLVKRSGHPQSGFYLDEFGKLAETLAGLERRGSKTLLIGVTFALLDFADRFPQPLAHTLIMETGGMKGRREEMVRADVHERLQRAFSKRSIHSEYGMTELLSQAYSDGAGIFTPPPWMRVLIREEDDPLSVVDRVSQPLQGAVNVIDLANIWSCSFIATDDLGRLHPGGQFEILGRSDNSDIRGCSLLAV